LVIFKSLFDKQTLILQQKTSYKRHNKLFTLSCDCQYRVPVQVIVWENMSSGTW